VISRLLEFVYGSMQCSGKEPQLSGSSVSEFPSRLDIRL
jgi:hypothetical protein